MIVLDTNVISAMMEKREEGAVTRWLDQQELNSLCTTAVNVHELRYGIEKMAHGRRRAKLTKDLDVVLSVLANRILPLDSAAAATSGQIQAQREVAGRPIDLADCLIVGISVSRGAALATRNVRHFVDLPVKVIDPWAYAAE
jgi:predicted nucleic acid-binding protein